MKHNLTDVSETSLLTLWARAQETQKSNPFIIDQKAVEILEQIDYDFSRFSGTKLSQIGVTVRTYILDHAVRNFIKTTPDPIVINLGAGMDTRYERLNLACKWYELDLPSSIELRKKLFSETENYKFIACSAFDYSWLEQITTPKQNCLIIAEGLLMYFSEDQVFTLIRKLCDNFRKSELLIELLAPLLIGRAKHHDTLKKIDGKADFKWSIKKANELEKTDKRIKYLEEWNYFDFYKSGWGIHGYIFRLPYIKPKLSNRIAHYSIV